MRKTILFCKMFVILLFFIIINCGANLEYPDIDRHSKIPGDVYKMDSCN